MFCQKCGTSMSDVATACPSCHAAVFAAAPGQTAASVKAAYGSALGALKTLAADPVGRLPAVYESLGEAKAKQVGLAFGLLSFACFLLGGYWLFPFKDGLFEFLGAKGVFKCLFFAVVPFLCTTVGLLAGRKVAGSRGGLGGDCLVSGAALLPASLAMLVDGLLGYENYASMLAISVFAACAGILMLQAGATRIAGMSERAATVVIPLVVMLAMWLGKLTAGSILSGGFGGGSSGFGGFGY
jgi:spore maturation protein SpmA